MYYKARCNYSEMVMPPEVGKTGYFGYYLGRGGAILQYILFNTTNDISKITSFILSNGIITGAK